MRESNREREREREERDVQHAVFDRNPPRSLTLSQTYHVNVV